MLLSSYAEPVIRQTVFHVSNTVSQTLKKTQKDTISQKKLLLCCQTERLLLLAVLV